MSFMRRKIRAYLLLSISALALVLAYNNCTQTAFKKAISQTAFMNSGNGGAYEGKLTRYASFDVSQPCLEMGSNLKPLPNKQIHLFENSSQSSLELVREQCKDLKTPQAIPPEAVTISSTGELTYSGSKFSAQELPGDFDIVAASCPAGYLPQANAVRTNLFNNAFNIMAPYWWYPQGLVGTLTGSLGSLPRFQVLRQTSEALEFYHRPHQEVALTAGTEYAFTALVQQENVKDAYLSGWYQNGMDMNVYFDLNTGVGKDVGSIGTTDLRFSSRPFSGGWILTIYFTAPTSGINALGVTTGPPVGPNGINIQPQPSAQIGDSISVTALQLEELSSFCFK